HWRPVPRPRWPAVRSARWPQATPPAPPRPSRAAARAAGSRHRPARSVAAGCVVGLHRSPTVSVSVLARMVAASVSQIRATDVTNPLCRWLYNVLWIAPVTVQLFWRSIGSVGQALAVATRKQALYLAEL